MESKSELDEKIRATLAEHAGLSVDIRGLSDDDDLFQAGMTSLASVSVMLSLEGKFEIEFPDEYLKPSIFGTINGIRSALMDTLHRQ